MDLIFDELQRVASQCETMELSRFPELRDRVLEVVNKMLRACVGPTQTTIQNLIQIELAYINTNHPDFIGGSRAVAQLMEKMQRDSGTNAASPNVSIGNGGSMVNLETLKPRASISDAGNGLLLSGRKHKNDPRSASVKLPQVPVTMRPMEEPTDRERIETEIIKSLLASYFDIVRKNFLDLVPKSIMCFMVLYAQQNVQNELVSALYREDQLADLLRETSDIATRRSTCCEMRTLLQRALEIVNEVRDFNTFK